jgi:NADPH:quinone reductase-like Zn-dependent oxidoreductase
MKAAVYYENGGPEVLRYEDVPDPVCAPDGVVVDVEVVSLEGGDLLSRAFTPLVQRPYIERVHRGELRVMVDECFALRDAGRAHAHVEQRAAFGRVVLLPRG